MTEMNKVVLFGKSSSGSILKWQIWSEHQYIYIDYGVIGGETVTISEHVPLALATRTLEEQIISRIDSRVNKKIDAGYVLSLEDATNNVRTNSIGYKRPAKCAPWNTAKKTFPYTQTYLQTKLDGHHCNIINDNGNYVAYSSNGKIIDTIPEIIRSLEIPNGRTVEGELYHHRTPLQTISSWVKRRQEDTKKLKYIIYDIDLPECYSTRYKELNKIVILDSKFAEIHKTDLLTGHFNILPLLKSAVSKGFEGLVARPTGFPHEDGKRSKGVVKIKPIHFTGEFAIDDEFLVINILSSKDGHARLLCETEIGKRFMVLCHGNSKYKREVLKNKDDYINKHVEIEFAGFTKSKIPQHPVAKRWRDKFDE